MPAQQQHQLGHRQHLAAERSPCNRRLMTLQHLLRLRQQPRQHLAVRQKYSKRGVQAQPCSKLLMAVQHRLRPQQRRRQRPAGQKQGCPTYRYLSAMSHRSISPHPQEELLCLFGNRQSVHKVRLPLYIRHHLAASSTALTIRHCVSCLMQVCAQPNFLYIPRSQASSAYVRLLSIQVNAPGRGDLLNAPAFAPAAAPLPAGVVSLAAKRSAKRAAAEREAQLAQDQATPESTSAVSHSSPTLPRLQSGRMML